MPKESFLGYIKIWVLSMKLCLEKNALNNKISLIKNQGMFKISKIT